MSMQSEPGALAPAGGVPLCVPEISGNEWTYVRECLDTGWVSSVGSYVERFERETAACVGAAHGVAAVNGTSALHLALLVAGVEPEDEVLVSDLTFIAPANAIRYAGAWPVFIDAEPEFWQMDVSKVAHFLESECRRVDGELRNRTTGRRVKALLPVHILGHPVDMDPLTDLARRFGLAVIEDATESLGARYKGRPVGSLADVACFSFNGNKLLTTGGGGMMVTDNLEWARRARYLSTQAKDDPIEYVHGAVGFNYRLTNVLAAIGCAQLERLDEFVAIKRQIAERYRELLGTTCGIALMPEAEWAGSAFWMYTMLVDENRFGLDSRALLKRLAEHRIQARPLWQPLHLAAPYQGCPSTDCSVAERLNRTALSLPCSVGLTADDQARVAAVINGSG